MREYNLREILGAVDDEDLMGEDLMGEDLMGEDDDLMGRRGRRRPQRGTAGRLARASIAPGVPSTGGRMQPLAFGAATFVNAGATQITLSAEPQRPCIIRKLVASVSRVGPGATAAVLIGSITVGSNNQIVNSGNLPVELFDTATQNNQVAFDAAQPGVQVNIVINLNGAALGPGETITVSFGAIVETIG